MTEFRITRIVIACDAMCENMAAIRLATRLAARWEAAVHAVFVEDRDLVHAAAHPLTRHVGLHGNDPLDRAALLLHFDLEASRVRAALEAAARPLGLVWSFAIVDEPLTAETLPLLNDEMLVAEANSRPFAGQWRTSSRMAASAREEFGTVLLMGTGPEWRDGVAVLVQGATGSGRRAVAVATSIAGKFAAPLRILLASDAVAPAEARRWAQAVDPAVAARCRVEPVSAEPRRIAAVLARNIGELVVLDAEDDGRMPLQDLLKTLHNDVLLVR